MNTRWRVELLGGLRLQGNRCVITRFPRRKAGSLLGYLAYRLGRTYQRDELIELLWPGEDPQSSRHKLSVALSALRELLEPPGVPDSSVVIAGRDTISLNSEEISTDVSEFETHFWRPNQTPAGEVALDTLRRLAQLYQGPLLQGYYEEWILTEQRRLEAIYLEIQRRLVTALEQRREYAEAVEVTQQALGVDPWREDTHRQLIRLFAASGEPHVALRHYAEFSIALQKEYGTAPSRETQELIREIEKLQPAFGSPSGSAVPPKAAREPQDISTGPAVQFAADPDPIGGAVPLDSPFYVTRSADAEFGQAIAKRTSIVLVRGARQVGKTSLLARGLHQARQAGDRVVYTDFQLLNDAQFDSASMLLKALGRQLLDQLSTSIRLNDHWDPEDGPNVNFRRLLRLLIVEDPQRPLVWGLDEVDRLFPFRFGSEIFALFRSWHNERSFDPCGPWQQLTLILAYATEAHLFISDLNQSPFNVGTRLTLEDFTYDQVSQLNRLYGRPLRTEDEVRRLYRLLAGHPYLVRRALQEMTSRHLSMADVEVLANRDDWAFGEHLRRLRLLLARDPELREAMRALLVTGTAPGADAFSRLRSAGVLVGETAREARSRCELYSRYLLGHLFQDEHSPGSDAGAGA